MAGIARGLYERVFKFLVEVCNKTLVDPTMKKAVFIGVLDIAGFEIFKVIQLKIIETLGNRFDSIIWIIIRTFMPIFSR